MGSLPTVFDICRPRPDVEAGTTKDEQFAADLAQVVSGTAPDEYKKPDVFFAHSHPTRGLKELLKAAAKRLSGQGGEVASVIRLDTQYGGGKTHGLIALVHAVKGMKGVTRPEEFVDPGLLPRDHVHVAALDGENSDPADGLTLEGDLRAYSLWGALAYRLRGVEGYRRVQESDRKHVAPGAETLRELFAGEPALILLDEVSVYLRKVERVHPGASGQFTAFLQALLKAVETSPRVALVFTLAVGKDAEAKDAYREEHERALAALEEAKMVASRKATQINPTEEDETADVLRRRLFQSVDLKKAGDVVDAYTEAWSRNQSVLPPGAMSPETRDLFRRGYPLHPETMTVLTEKMSSLSTFQRTRGMLRLLARTVHTMWKSRPEDAFAIHPHHIDPGFGPIRDEITTRLGQGEYAPALKSDVAAVPGDDPAVAQWLDLKHNPGQIPITSYIARTIFLNTLAFGDSAKGINPDHLNFSVCSPLVEPSFIEQARLRFLQESLHLDDRPGAPMRFMVEPNLTQVIRRYMQEVDSSEVRSELELRIGSLFGKPGSAFNLVPFAGEPYEVPDEVGDGRPFLVLIHYEAHSITAEPKGPPPFVEDMFRHKGTERLLRELRNNVLFVVADERQIVNMRDRVRRRLALRELTKPEHIRSLAEHQQHKVKEEYEKSPFEVAEAILHSYRHLFFPHSTPMNGAKEPLAHAVMEVHNVSDQPGNAQTHIARVLRDHRKLLAEGDPPEAPAYVRDQTPLKQKGEISTLELRNEYRRAPRLSMLLSDSPLVACIRNGIDSQVFIYREENQVWGKGDPSPTIRISDNAFVHTIADAEKKRLWPRTRPLSVHFSASPEKIQPGGSSELTVTVMGGVEPFEYHGSLPELTLQGTTQTVARVAVTPRESARYEVRVTDSRGEKQSVYADVLVFDGEKTKPPKPVPPFAKPRVPTPSPELTAQGPLAQALTELWEKARKANVKSIDKLVVTFYDAAATWKVHQAIATLKEAQVTCRFEAEMTGDGVSECVVHFDGVLPKANAVKAFLDPQLRDASEHQFEAVYTITFGDGLAVAPDKADALTKSLTRYGSGEAYVEAHAAPREKR